MSSPSCSTPTPTQGSATRRLIACLESFAHDEDGAAGHDDWPALAALLERELPVMVRLAREAAPDEREDPRLLARARALHRRHVALERRLDLARARAVEEKAALEGAARRLRSVRGAYAPDARPGPGFRPAAA